MSLPGAGRLPPCYKILPSALASAREVTILVPPPPGRHQSTRGPRHPLPWRGPRRERPTSDVLGGFSLPLRQRYRDAVMQQLLLESPVAMGSNGRNPRGMAAAHDRTTARSGYESFETCSP